MRVEAAACDLAAASAAAAAPGAARACRHGIRSVLSPSRALLERYALPAVSLAWRLTRRPRPFYPKPNKPEKPEKRLRHPRLPPAGLHLGFPVGRVGAGGRPRRLPGAVREQRAVLCHRVWHCGGHDGIHQVRRCCQLRGPLQAGGSLRAPLPSLPRQMRPPQPSTPTPASHNRQSAPPHPTFPANILNAFVLVQTVWPACDGPTEGVWGRQR